MRFYLCGSIHWTSVFIIIIYIIDVRAFIAFIFVFDFRFYNLFSSFLVKFFITWREIPEESWFIVIFVEILIHVKENCVIVLRWCNAAEEWLCAIRNYPLWCCNKQNINWVMLWIKKMPVILCDVAWLSWMIIILNVERERKIKKKYSI